MRILKPGIRKKPKEVEYITKCHYCKCVYTYKQKDIQGYIDFEYLVCPSCECLKAVPLFKKKYKGE